MKVYRKLLILAAIFVPFLSACEFTELDLQENPNGAGLDQLDIEFLYNDIQLNFKDFFEETWELAPLARMSTKNEFLYNIAYPDSIGDLMWTFAYEGLFTSVEQLLLRTNNSTDFQLERGSAQILKAYTLFSLVDIFGDVPLAEAGQGAELISPKPESGASVYSKAIILLDEAIQILEKPGRSTLSYDHFYEGDVNKWIAFANTLKLRAYANTRLVDPTSGQKIAEILANEDIINETEEAFVFRYGTTRLTPNSRHPLYNSAYESEETPYLSNYYMWLLAGNPDMPDPRIRFYFYRQHYYSTNLDPTIYACYNNQGAPDNTFYPAHYAAIDPKLPYCIAAEDGYYGRDHLNGSEIAPDGSVRTTYGVYPAGGSFDYGFFYQANISGNFPEFGKGIQPIWMSSFTHFTLAETHLLTNSGGNARNALAMGIQQSFDRVLQYTPTELEEFCDFFPCPLNSREYQEILNSQGPYIAKIMGEWDRAVDDEARLNIIAREYLIALWGNGLEAYNLYRRTAKPFNMQPAISTIQGDFPRSLLYPAIHVNRNLSVDQKTRYTPVFWDTNDASLFR